MAARPRLEHPAGGRLAPAAHAFWARGVLRACYHAGVMAQSDKAAGTACIEVNLEGQRLTLQVPGEPDREYAVSTALRGPGELEGSGCTPRGAHLVRAKIGAGQPLGAVFAARRPTGEIYSEELRAAFPDRDWILTRILWLSGLEPGRNRLGLVDTMRRFIYIHGTPDSEPMGEPRSHGCIRMTNQDVADLLDRVDVVTRLEIH